MAAETELDEAELLFEAYLQDINSIVNSARLLQQRIVNTERCPPAHSSRYMSPSPSSSPPPLYSPPIGHGSQL